MKAIDALEEMRLEEEDEDESDWSTVDEDDEDDEHDEGHDHLDALAQGLVSIPTYRFAPSPAQESIAEETRAERAASPKTSLRERTAGLTADGSHVSAVLYPSHSSLHEELRGMELTMTVPTEQRVDWAQYTYFNWDPDAPSSDQIKVKQPCTVEKNRQRAEFQRAWEPTDRRDMKMFLEQGMPVSPKAIPLGRKIRLGGVLHPPSAPLYVDSACNIFVFPHPNFFRAYGYAPCLDIHFPNTKKTTKLAPCDRIVLCEGEYHFSVPEGGLLSATLCEVNIVKIPELKDETRVNLGDNMASQKSRTCDVCGQVWNRSMSKCAGCRNAEYCSAVCQRHAWPSHKAACKRARERAK